jgi:hypothetical protein
MWNYWVLKKDYVPLRWLFSGLISIKGRKNTLCMNEIKDFQSKRLATSHPSSSFLLRAKPSRIPF